MKAKAGSKWKAKGIQRKTAHVQVREKDTKAKLVRKGGTGEPDIETRPPRGERRMDERVDGNLDFVDGDGSVSSVQSQVLEGRDIGSEECEDQVH